MTQAMDTESKKVFPICTTSAARHKQSSEPKSSFALETAVSLAKDGAVDYRGQPVDKKTTGRLKANVFIIGNVDCSHLHVGVQDLLLDFFLLGCSKMFGAIN